MWPDAAPHDVLALDVVSLLSSLSVFDVSFVAVRCYEAVIKTGARSPWANGYTDWSEMNASVALMNFLSYSLLNPMLRTSASKGNVGVLLTRVNAGEFCSPVYWVLDALVGHIGTHLE